MPPNARHFLPSRFRKLLPTLLLLAVAAIFTGCVSAPITGRNQLILVPNSEMQAMATAQYGEVLSQSNVVTGTPEARMIEDVGRRIASATDEYVRRSGLDMQFEWEFSLIQSDDLNAWCMPGGKIAFYTGILPVCQGPNGVAVVMGHEVAHALARHGAERFSQALASQLGVVALDVALRNQPTETRQLWMTAVGAGLTFGVVLPYGRKQEYEADHIGLILTAMAGFDPREAIPFWQRMGQAGGGQPPEFMSTHPAGQNRIKQLQELMPEALKYYDNRAAGSGGSRQ